MPQAVVGLWGSLLHASADAASRSWRLHHEESMTHVQAVDTGKSKKMAAATRHLGSRAMATAKDGATWALLLKILLVSLLRRFQPKAVSSFELLCLAVPLPDVMARWMVRRRILHSRNLHSSPPASACMTLREVLARVIPQVIHAYTYKVILHFLPE